MPVPFCNNSSNVNTKLYKPTKNGTANCTRICAIVWNTVQLILVYQHNGTILVEPNYEVF